MTGYAENAASSNFLTAGMEIIAKPFNMDALASRVRKMLETARQ
jgi:DNA-binding response OmpR family regulator